MKVPLKWLKDYIDIKLPTADLAGKLTMAGIETAGSSTISISWDNIIVGQITAVNPHPNADRLHLATLDLGPNNKPLSAEPQISTLMTRLLLLAPVLN